MPVGQAAVRPTSRRAEAACWACADPLCVSCRAVDGYEDAHTVHQSHQRLHSHDDHPVSGGHCYMLSCACICSVLAPAVYCRCALHLAEATSDCAMHGGPAHAGECTHGQHRHGLAQHILKLESNLVLCWQYGRRYAGLGAAGYWSKGLNVADIVIFSLGESPLARLAAGCILIQALAQYLVNLNVW